MINVVHLLSVLFIATGFGYILMPGFLLGLTGGFQLDGTALVDVRATYGGFQLGLGCYLLLAGSRQSPAALLSLIAILLFAVGTVRLLGYLLGDSIGVIHLCAALLELLVAGLCSVAVCRNPDQSNQS